MHGSEVRNKGVSFLLDASILLPSITRTRETKPVAFWTLRRAEARRRESRGVIREKEAESQSPRELPIQTAGLCLIGAFVALFFFPRVYVHCSACRRLLALLVLGFTFGVLLREIRARARSVLGFFFSVNSTWSKVLGSLFTATNSL